MAIIPAIAEMVQEQLNVEYGLSLVVDGMFGPASEAGLNHCVLIPSDWPTKRRVTGYIDTGSLPAPWRGEEGTSADENGQWPKATTDACNAYYGEVGKNQGKVQCPYPLKIAWDTSKTVNRFTAHEKVCDSIERVLKRVLDHYGDAVYENGLDLWGGCLNVRKMRGGSKYSMHSWGIAIDWNPTANRLRWGKDKAGFAKPEFDKWWDLWEEEGWVGLGRVKNYDWMHVQAARVK
jgi:hypothetical protein